MKASVPSVTAAGASVTRLSVAQVAVGPITVGQLQVRDMAVGIRAGQASLDHVTVTVTLAISVVWHVHVDLPWPIPDIDTGDTSPLGSLTIPFDMGDADVPSLRNIDLDIGRLSAANLRVSADPITGVQANGLVAEGIGATDAVIPVSGVTLSGIGVSSLVIDGVAIPAASVAGATVQRVTGPPLALAALNLHGLALPQASASDISAANLSVPVKRRDPFQFGNLDLGLIRLHLEIGASAQAHIDRLRMSGVSISASAAVVELQNVTLPYEALNITLGDLGIQTIDIPTIGVA